LEHDGRQRCTGGSPVCGQFILSNSIAGNTTSIQGALNKWISPMIGDMSLSMVDNVTLKPLVKKLVKSGLAPETIRKYVEYVKKVMSSKLAPNGESLYPRV
jgi:hypothetical protein